MTVQEIVLAALNGDEEKALAGLRALLSQPADEPDRLMDLRTAAAYLGLSEDALDRRARRGAIPSMQEGERCKRWFSKAALDVWKGESFQ